jgi:hypothetical protein
LQLAANCDSTTHSQKPPELTFAPPLTVFSPLAAFYELTVHDELEPTSSEEDEPEGEVAPTVEDIYARGTRTPKIIENMKDEKYRAQHTQGERKDEPLNKRRLHSR